MLMGVWCEGCGRRFCVGVSLQGSLSAGGERSLGLLKPSLLGRWTPTKIRLGRCLGDGGFGVPNVS